MQSSFSLGEVAVSRIITFHGADHKCGTSQLALCTAEKLSQLCPSLKLLLVHAEEPLGDDYTPNLGESMENIRPYLSDGLFDPEEIAGRSKYCGNLYVIGGANSFGSGGMYHPDAAEYFLRGMGGFFDMVICDSGAELDHGLALGSLFCADMLFMVFTQSEVCIRHYEWKEYLLRQLGLCPDMYVVNKFSRSSPYDLKYFSDRLGAELKTVSRIACSPNAEQSELMSKSLLCFRSTVFSRDIEKMARSIISGYGQI